MCGIAGLVDSRADDVGSVVEKMVRTLDHRGPDSWGVHTGAGAAIGQTRLAIIDLVTGDPPITTADRSVGAVLNGEIYNYRALREELRRAGHVLRTEGDTEVIAHLAETHEPVALARRLEGMFAFAVWDDGRRRLVLGRDRFGKKPLYYWHQGNRFVFGSEIKTVLAAPDVSRDLDPDAVPAYLTFGYVPTPRTFFAGIRSVPPGHVLVLDHGAEPRLEQYWAPAIPPMAGSAQLRISADDAAREVRSRLTSAVASRMIADVPLGAFLSGGVDSSAIVGIMSELSTEPVRTFTIGFEDTEGFDERPYAKLVADRFHTDHTEFVVRPQAIDLVERLVWHHDQPFGDSSAIPTFLLSELTRSHVTVALCGDGGDEVFAGYERFSGALLADRAQPLLTRVRSPLLRALALAPAGGTVGARARMAERFVQSAALGLPDAFLAWVTFVPEQWRTRLIGSSDNWGIEDYRRVWAGSAGSDLLDRLQQLTARTYLLDDLLPKVDRMGMAHALEVRSPFLDHDLFEFAMQLPPRLRATVTSRKRVLKRAVRGLLPREILGRKKHGFGVPLDQWFRSDLLDYVSGTIGAGDARLGCHVDMAAVHALLDEHARGVRNHGGALWTLLTLEVFLRREGW